MKPPHRAFLMLNPLPPRTPPPPPTPSSSLWFFGRVAVVVLLVQLLLATVSVNVAAADTSTDSHNRPLRLDLSGRIKCLIFASDSKDDTDDDNNIVYKEATIGHMAKPLFYPEVAETVNRRSWSPIPSRVTLGLDYDFSQCWYGLKRIVSTVAWSKKDKKTAQSPVPNVFSPPTEPLRIMPSSVKVNDDDVLLATEESGRGPSSSFSVWIPCHAQFTAEKGLWDFSDQAAAQVDLSWKAKPLFFFQARNRNNNSNSNSFLPVPRGPVNVRVRADSSHTITSSTSVPIHERFIWHGRIFGQIPKSSSSGYYYRNQMKFPLPPPTTTQDSISWLIPDVSLNTMGDLTSENHVWFPWSFGGNKKYAGRRSYGSSWGTRMMNSDNDRNNNGRVGLRLTLRRRCALDFLEPLAAFASRGNNNNYDDDDGTAALTWLGLELQGMTPRTRTRTRLDMALENIPATARVSVFQDWIVCTDDYCGVEESLSLLVD